MDYSKSAVNKKIRQLKTTTTRLSTKVRVSAYRLFLVLIVFLASAGVMAAFGTIEGLIASAPEPNSAPVNLEMKFAVEVKLNVS